jgi:hypothetical protein
VQLHLRLTMENLLHFSLTSSDFDLDAGSRIFLIRRNDASILEDAVPESITMSIGMRLKAIVRR